MKLVAYSIKVKESFKKSLCIKINLFIMRIYARFRDCSGVKVESDKILKVYEENERKVEIVNKNMPKLMTETEKLISRNKYLEGRVVYMFNELLNIDKYARNKDVEMIISLLEKYDFSRKMEY